MVESCARDNSATRRTLNDGAPWHAKRVKVGSNAFEYPQYACGARAIAAVTVSRRRPPRKSRCTCPPWFYIGRISWKRAQDEHRGVPFSTNTVQGRLNIARACSRSRGRTSFAPPPPERRCRRSWLGDCPHSEYFPRGVKCLLLPFRLGNWWGVPSTQRRV